MSIRSKTTHILEFLIGIESTVFHRAIVGMMASALENLHYRTAAIQTINFLILPSPLYPLMRRACHAGQGMVFRVFFGGWLFRATRLANRSIVTVPFLAIRGIFRGSCWRSRSIHLGLWYRSGAFYSIMFVWYLGGVWVIQWTFGDWCSIDWLPWN